MLTSAVDRTPVEIWSNILTLLLPSPLFPQPDATLPQLMALFSIQCDSYRLDRDLAQVAGRLRCVCRSWDKLIRSIQPTTVYCNLEPQFKDFTWPGIVPYASEADESGNEQTRPELLQAWRLEGWMPCPCYCTRRCRQSITPEAVQKLEEKDAEYLNSRLTKPQHYFVPSQDLDRLQVFIPGPYATDNNPTTLFDHLPNLKALDWPDIWFDLFFDALIQHSIHQKLTHLKMALWWDQVYHLKCPVEFRCLEFLDLMVTEQSGDDPKRPDQLNLGNWATFPALRKLRFTAHTTESRRSEVASFFKRVGSKLTGLILELPVEFQPWITTKVWDFFPSLSEFGYHDHLPSADHSPPPLSMNLYTLLYRVDDRFYWDSLEDFLQMCQAWQIKRMTMLESWKDAERVLATTRRFNDHLRLPRSLAFYERLGALGLEIYDRDGRSIKDPLGACFLETLRNGEARVIDEHSSDLELSVLPLMGSQLPPTPSST